MAEHYTQGRQGQGARRRRNNNHQGRHRRQRMPRPEPMPASKPSLLRRILNFFGFGKKKEQNDNKREKKNRNNPPQKVRVAKTNNHGGNPAAAGKSRRRATSTPPTRNARLYVGNLSYEANESELEDLFKGFGNVRSVDIIYNPRTYKSKGYAFVEMYQLEDARKAAEVLHGQPFMGRELMVSAASDRPEPQEKSENKPAETATPAPAEPAPAAEEAAPAAPEPAPAEEKTEE